jgi:phospholipid N-methyltransferase
MCNCFRGLIPSLAAHRPCSAALLNRSGHRADGDRIPLPSFEVPLRATLSRLDSNQERLTQNQVFCQLDYGRLRIELFR